MTAAEKRMIIGRNIRVLRGNMSQNQLAFKAQLPSGSSFVCMIENGTRGGSADTLSKIASALDVPLDALYDGIPIEEREGRDFARERDIRKIIGENIRQCRGDMTQRELAVKAGFSSVQVISLIEHGKRLVDEVTLGRIAEALGVPITELYKGVPCGDGPIPEENVS